MSRKTARENAYKLIFEYLFERVPNTRTYSILSCGDMDESDIKYLEKVYFGVIENYDELTETIAHYSEGFALDRIFKPDLSALLLSLFEIKYMPDIPTAVSINEAVELVKRYSTEKSNVFVNGVLSAINKDINEKK